VTQTSSSDSPITTTDPTEDPLRFGVGARVTVAVMRDDYAATILRVLDEVDTTGLALETGDVSTWVGGGEADLQRYLTDLVAAVAATGAHASVSVLLSRGCPGEVVCELPGGAGPRTAPIPPARATGARTAAEWALYPLADDVRAGVVPDHMRDIEAAIALARDNGTFRGSAHFVTRLEGDIGDVIATVVGGWLLVGRTVQHVTSHVTLSLNSPTRVG
jgi:energy-coupling factor transport system substrate-specific component